jgi:hypothetical protein
LARQQAAIADAIAAAMEEQRALAAEKAIADAK